MLQLIPPERFAQVQQAFREQESEEAGVRNLDAMAALFGSAFFPWCGRAYECPPLPGPLGGRLLKLHLRLSKIPNPMTDPAHAEEEGAVCAEAVALFPLACKPIGWRRFFWRFARNPFRSASVREVAELLGFFCTARMRSRVRGQ